MTWVVELAVITPALSDVEHIGILARLTRVMPDVPFCDAASRDVVGTAISVGRVGGRTVIVDPSCRLSTSIQSLLRSAPNAEVIVARLDTPLFERFSPNRAHSTARDLEFSVSGDEEIDAWRSVEAATGLTLDSLDDSCDLNKHNFAVYR